MRSRATGRLPHRERALFLLLVLCAACTGGSTPEPATERTESASPRPTAADLPERGEFVDNALGLAIESRAQLREALGEPDSIAQEVVPNRHVPGVLDTIFTVHYPDLVARFHHPGGGRDLTSMVEVASNRHLRYPVIGLDVQAIEKAFGRPDEASDSSMTYYCTSCVAGNDPVELLFADGEVRRVRFSYYVD